MINYRDNTNAAFSKFFNSVNKIVKKHAPLRPLSKLKAKQFSKPWITRGLQKSIKVKKYENMKNINSIVIKYLHSLDEVRSRTIIHF